MKKTTKNQYFTAICLIESLKELLTQNHLGPGYQDIQEHPSGTGHTFTLKIPGGEKSLRYWILNSGTIKSVEVIFDDAKDAPVLLTQNLY